MVCRKIITIDEGYAQHTILHSAGRDFEGSTKIFTEQGFSFTATTEKEETCELPDGNIIIVGADRFRCVKCCSSQVSLAS